MWTVQILTGHIPFVDYNLCRIITVHAELVGKTVGFITIDSRGKCGPCSGPLVTLLLALKAQFNEQHMDAFVNCHRRGGFAKVVIEVQCLKQRLQLQQFEVE